MEYKFLIVGTIFNLAMVDTLPCMCAAALSLFLTASRWLDSLTYIESITDAYSQYFGNDREQTENNKQSQSATYHLNKLLPASAWSSLSYLIISA